MWCNFNCNKMQLHFVGSVEKQNPWAIRFHLFTFTALWANYLFYNPTYIFTNFPQFMASYSIHILRIQFNTKSNWLFTIKFNKIKLSFFASHIWNRVFSQKSKCFVLRLYTKLFLLPGVVAVLKKFPHLLVTQDEAIFAPKKFLIMPRH